MVISDLQYLESVESSTLVGAGRGKKYLPKKYKKGYGVGSININNNFTIQVAVATGKYSTAFNVNETDQEID